MPYNYLETDLRVRAREKISQGSLPCKHPIRMWGGRGTGEQTCSLCEKIITPEDVEYELEHHSHEGVDLHRFHFLCHAAWQVECAREETLKRGAP